MIRDTVSFLTGEGRRVFLDAEHFFDGFRTDKAYALEAVRTAVEAGADIIGTTLAGYTGERAKTEGPDLGLISALRRAELPALLVAEGRIHTPLHAAAAVEAGADSVVVGTAITHPTTITSWFTEAVEG